MTVRLCLVVLAVYVQVAELSLADRPAMRSPPRFGKRAPIDMKCFRQFMKEKAAEELERKMNKNEKAWKVKWPEVVMKTGSPVLNLKSQTGNRYQKEWHLAHPAPTGSYLNFPPEVQSKYITRVRVTQGSPTRVKRHLIPPTKSPSILRDCFIVEESFAPRRFQPGPLGLAKRTAEKFVGSAVDSLTGDGYTPRHRLPPRFGRKWDGALVGKEDLYRCMHF